MKYVQVGQSDLRASEIMMGTFRVEYLDTTNEVERFVKETLASGINYFDNSDFYGLTAPHGFSDARLGAALDFKNHSSLREEMVLQTKFGLKHLNKVYGGKTIMIDSDKKSIFESVEGSLKRLGTDYLDILLFHRPDPFMDPEEVADTFNQLQKEGKVKYFGISNATPSRIELMNSYLKTPLIVNQVHISIVDCDLFNYTNSMCSWAGLDDFTDAGAGTLDYCYCKGMQIQSWSPLTYYSKETQINNPELMHTWLPFVDDRSRFKLLNSTLDRLAKKYNVPTMSIVIAWFLSHPYHIVPCVGTTSSQHIQDLAGGTKIHLTRTEWYELCMAAGTLKQ